MRISVRVAGVKIPYYYEVNPQEKETLIPALGMTVRDLWIKMGTYAIRDNVFKDTWGLTSSPKLIVQWVY